MALLAELRIAGREPRDRVDQLPEHGRAQARAGADDQRHHRQPEPVTPNHADTDRTSEDRERTGTAAAADSAAARRIR